MSEEDDKLDMWEKAMGGFTIVWVLVLVWWVVSFFAGCRTGVSVKVKDSTGVNVGSISFEDSTWPIVSYFTGPTATFWVREGVTNVVVATYEASITNSTKACGIYESNEAKAISGSFEYQPSAIKAESGDR